MLKYAAVVVLAGVVGWDSPHPQSASCDPHAPPSAEQTARRRAAIGVARQINTAEARQWPATKTYAPLAELTDISIPAGFEVQVSTDGASYTFSVKDKQDECGFALFSDQAGLIYTASPLR
jgi:hypothetical protein